MELACEGEDAVAIEATVDDHRADRGGDGGADRGSVAALTVYDMCKAVDRGMRIEALRVVAKSGGKSGTFRQD